MKLIREKLSYTDNSPYYAVDDKKYYSRIYAQRAAQKISETPNEVWNKIQYVFPMDAQGEEPKEDIRELYKNRAKQIRKDYEYVRIWASGGCDSTQIIYSFKEAGVEPDELATYLQYPGSVNPSNNIEVEIGYNQMLPEIRKWWPNCKIKYYNILPEHYNWYSRNEVDHYFAYTLLHPPACNSQIPYEIYPELQELGRKYKTVDLFGGLEFHIGNDDKGWYYQFNDKDTNMAINGPYQEYFFSSIEDNRLFLKMLHCAKRHYIKNNLSGNQGISLSKTPELEFWFSDFNFVASKNHKTITGILDHGQKGTLRWQNMISSFMGQDTTINLLAHLKRLGDENPHWFHNDKIAEDIIGIFSKKQYFEEEK